VAGLILIVRTDIEQGNLPGAEFLQQLIAGHRVKLIALTIILLGQPPNLGKVILGHSAQRLEKVDDLITRYGIVNESALFARHYQAPSAQLLQMLRDSAHGQFSQLSQGLHTAFTLCHQLQKLEAILMAKGLGYRCQLLKKLPLFHRLDHSPNSIYG
jgi:hypothetical protein